MKKTFLRRHWIASGIVSIIFLICAITAIYYTLFELVTKIALILFLITFLLVCCLLYAYPKNVKREMHFYVWCTILGMLCTLVAFWIYALFNDFSYIGILTLQVDSWKKIEYIKSSDGGIIFLAILGACSVMMGLFGIMRKGILVLLNNIFSNKMDAGNYYEKEWDVHDELDSKRATSDDLRRAIMKKLWQPGYKQEVISKYKSNLIKFRLGTLLVMALGILIGLFGSYFSKEIWALSCCVALIVFAVLYLYLAKKYYKCPACGFELNIGWFAYQDGRSDPNFSNLESCPQCAAPFH